MLSRASDDKRVGFHRAALLHIGVRCTHFECITRGGHHNTDVVLEFTIIQKSRVLKSFTARGDSESSEHYFLAGRQIRWWGVAGSIYGSNVSANHMVGMMGIGFSIGFAQSHFELGAIFGLLMLCYLLLPVYRKLNIYTLSEYLSRRYDDRSRVAYSVIMISIIVFVMTVPAFYIGSRSINYLLQGDTGQAAVAVAMPIEPHAFRAA